MNRPRTAWVFLGTLLLLLLACGAPPAFGDDGDELLAQAQQLRAEEKFDEAARAYRKLRDEFPDHAVVRSGGAQRELWGCLQRAGKTKEEIEEIQRFLKDYPEHTECAYALYFLGHAYRTLGDEEKARQAWQEIIDKHPDDAMVEHAKGMLASEPPDKAQARSEPAQVRIDLGMDFIDFAEGAAAWLASVAVEEKGGLKWPEYDGTKAHRVDVYSGSSGICLFFLNMFRVTGKDEYRACAEKAARLLMQRAIKNKGGLCWENEREANDGTLIAAVSPGLYAGAAGIGHVFLELHEVTGKAEYLEYARGAADWIVATAQEDDGGCHWGQDTDIISGAAGIGLFLLEMNAATGDTKYLESAEAAGRWLISIAVDDGDGLKWKSSTAFDRFYTGFSHGTAGNAYYLARLSEATRNKEYLDAAEAGARWLVENGTVEHGGLKWFHYEPGGEDAFMTGWCHGPAGTCRLFLELYRLTGKEEYLDVVRKGTACLMATIDPADDAAPFHGLSMCCGAAGVGDFFLDAYGATHDDAYLEYAARIGEHLMRRAKPAQPGYKWTNYDRPNEEGKIYCGTGHMLGAAGIGSFFLKLHAFCTNAESEFMPFADKPEAKRADEVAHAAYVVLTNLDEQDEAYQAAVKLATHRGGLIVPFDPAQMTALRRTLAQLQPRYVALVLRSQDIDVNLHRRMIALSTRMDADPFCDFAFGFITGNDDKETVAFVERIIKAEKDGLPKSATSLAVISGDRSYVYDGADALHERLGYTERRIYPACVERDPAVVDFVEAHLRELEHQGIVSVIGNADPEGIWLFSANRNTDRAKHWPFDPEKVGWDPNGEMPRITADALRGLDLSPAVVWAGTCHSGVLHRAFVENDIVSTFGSVEKVTEYVVPEGRSVGLAILGCGPTAFLAPIGANMAYAVDVEEYRALTTGRPLGDVMRSRYNEIILDAGGRLDVQLYVPGAPPLDENAMRGGGANRLLYGDPLYAPFAATDLDYLDKQLSPMSVRPGFVLECEVIDDQCPCFWDMFGDDNANRERIYTTVELPADLGPVKTVTATAQDPEGQAIAVGKCLWAVEQIDGKTLLHVQINAPREALSRNGATARFTIMF